jgi:NitT/TauT family transport system substrate-binding protein
VKATTRVGRQLAAVMAAALLVAAGCRPAFVDQGGPAGTDGSAGADGSAGPAETAYPTDAPPPAFALKPATETNVQVRFFRGQGTEEAPLQYAQALDSYREVNLIVDLVPPIAGYDVFSVDPAAGTVTAWVGTVADVAPAPAGLALVAIGEVSGRDPTVIVRPSAEGSRPIRDLRGPVLADTTGAAASLRATLAAAGVTTPPTIVLPGDPSAPFDPTPLLDGTAKSAAVSLFDGWARIEEALAAAGEDPTAWTEAPVGTVEGALLGDLIWVRRADFEDPDARAAINAFVGVVAQSQIACRDALEDCAGTLAAQSDRTPEGLAWSIDQIDRLMFPAPDGIVHIDSAAWDRTIAAMGAAGVDGAALLTFTNDAVDAVTKAFGAAIDLTGKDWTPPPATPLIP